MHSLIAQVGHPAHLAPHLLRDPAGVRVGDRQVAHGHAPREEEAQLHWVHAVMVHHELGGEQEGEQQLVLLKQRPEGRGDTNV